MKKEDYLLDLSAEELTNTNGGEHSSAEIIGYGIVSGLALMTTGIYGWAYVTYNFYKD